MSFFTVETICSSSEGVVFSFSVEEGLGVSDWFCAIRKEGDARDKTKRMEIIFLQNYL